MITQNYTHASGRQSGRLDLVLEYMGAATRPVRSAVQPPIQLSRVRYDAPSQPGTAAFTLVHLGGILEGDSYDLRVALGPGAAASITTAAATQVYRMPHGAARQELTLQLASGSRLAWLPEPVILYAGARFSQTTHVELAPGALLGMLDVLVPGRLARGEINQFERYEMRLEVCSPSGACLVAERALLEPRRHNIASVGVLGCTPVLGSLYVLGDGVDADYWCVQVNQCDSHDIAGTVLPNRSGLLVRMLGTTPSAVHTQLLSLWSQISTHAEIRE